LLFRTLEFLSARQRLRRHLTHVGERGNAVGRIAAQTISDRQRSKIARRSSNNNNSSNKMVFQERRPLLLVNVMNKWVDVARPDLSAHGT
jgi:hypothetical protein